MNLRLSNVLIGVTTFIINQFIFDHIFVFLAEKNDWSFNSLLTIALVIICYLFSVVWILSRTYRMRIKRFLKFLFSPDA